VTPSFRHTQPRKKVFYFATRIFGPPPRFIVSRSFPQTHMAHWGTLEKPRIFPGFFPQSPVTQVFYTQQILTLRQFIPLCFPVRDRDPLLRWLPAAVILRQRRVNSSGCKSPRRRSGQEITAFPHAVRSPASERSVQNGPSITRGQTWSASATFATSSAAFPPTTAHYQTTVLLCKQNFPSP
jgi:hypothetical protein